MENLHLAANSSSFLFREFDRFVERFKDERKIRLWKGIIAGIVIVGAYVRDRDVTFFPLKGAELKLDLA